MSYRLKRGDKTVVGGVRRIALSQIDAAIGEIDDQDLDVHETVHQVRKRCKKLRGLIRLVRPAFTDYKAENARFRAAASSLSALRDTQAMIESYNAAMEAYEDDDEVQRRDFALIRRRLTERKKRAVEEGEIEDKLLAVRAIMLDARDRPRGWTLDADEFDAIGGGVKKTCKRARKALDRARAEPTPVHLHELRKRVKYHRYHADLLRGIWPGVMSAHRQAADRIGDRLGTHHNFAVLRDLLRDGDEPLAGLDRIDAFDLLIARRQARLAAEAMGLAVRLFAPKPKALVKAWKTYWQVWREEQALGARHADAARGAADAAAEHA